MTGGCLIDGRGPLGVADHIIVIIADRRAHAFDSSFIAVEFIEFRL